MLLFDGAPWFQGQERRCAPKFGSTGTGSSSNARDSSQNTTAQQVNKRWRRAVWGTHRSSSSADRASPRKHHVYRYQLLTQRHAGLRHASSVPWDGLARVGFVHATSG